jgi:hypothetical protein
MDRYVLIHTENPSKLRKLLPIIKSHPGLSGCHLFLNAKKYIPWSSQDLNGIITSFRTYRAYPTDKNGIDSIVEMIDQVREGEVFIINEDCSEIPELLEEFGSGFMVCEKSKLASLNLDTKYSSLKWFLIDLISQKNRTKIDLTDESDDCRRYLEKVNSPLFLERVIYIDGGMGDHVMALPLLNRISEEVYICCKYPHVFSNLNFKGSVYWHDELFGGYNRFVYSFGSSNNSKTIVDAFFDMYGIQRLETDVLKYLGDRVKFDINTSDKKIAIIGTSASKHDGRHSNKNWVSIRWMKLVNELKIKGFYVVQAGSESDDQIPNVDLKFLDKPLENLAWLIEQSDLWISVDTFLHHFAAAIKPKSGVCLTPFYNDHAKHPGVTYIEKDCGKNYYDRRWWLDWQQPERKESMQLIQLEDVVKKIKTTKRIVVYSAGTIDDNCSNWRVFQQYTGLEGFEFIHKDTFGPNIEEDLTADVVIIGRPFIYCLGHIKYLRSNGIKVILDYDDPLPYVNLNDPAFFESNIETVQLYRNCDLITTSTNNLKYYFSHYTEVKCEVLPNVINPKYINERKTDNEDKIILGWFGSRGHIESVVLIKDVLLKILNELDNVYLNIYSDNPDIYSLLVHEKVSYYNYNRNFLEFQNTVGDIDINLAPLSENFMNLMKSNIRIILPGYKGIPSVVSNFAEYKDLGTENVLICNNEEDWYKNIVKLITDKKTYKKYSENIKSKINSGYSFESWNETKRNLLNSLIDG